MEEPTTKEPFAAISKSVEAVEVQQRTQILDDENLNEQIKRRSSVKKPFSSDKCERKFVLNSGLKKHQRKHKNEANQYVCDDC